MSESLNPRPFAGKLVVVTGAHGAYGREIAGAFLRQGAKLLLSDLSPSLIPSDELPLGSYTYFSADLSNAADLEALSENLLAHGTPDVLINNAGLFPFVDVLDMPLDAFDRVLNVNLRAPFRLMQRVGSAMAQRGSGAICNISSGAASVVRENGAVYGASKAGLEHLTRAFAVRLGPHGVRVNAVRPGLRGDTRDPIPESHLQRVGSAVPLRRLARPGEVSNLVTFLTSDAAAFISGETIAVDGGNAINRRIPA